MDFFSKNLKCEYIRCFILTTVIFTNFFTSLHQQVIDLSTTRPPVLVFMIYVSLARILIIIWKPYRSIIILLTNYRTRWWWYRFALAWLTSEYNRWPNKAGPSRRHFGRAVDRSIVSVISMTSSQPWVIVLYVQAVEQGDVGLPRRALVAAAHLHPHNQPQVCVPDGQTAGLRHQLCRAHRALYPSLAHCVLCSPHVVWKIVKRFKKRKTLTSGNHEKSFSVPFVCLNMYWSCFMQWL